MELNERVVKLEEGQTHHDKRIVELEEKSEQQHKDLSELKTILLSIKFWLYGVGSLYVIEQVGFLPIIKKFLGI